MQPFPDGAGEFGDIRQQRSVSELVTAVDIEQAHQPSGRRVPDGRASRGDVALVLTKVLAACDDERPQLFGRGTEAVGADKVLAEQRAGERASGVQPRRERRFAHDTGDETAVGIGEERPGVHPRELIAKPVENGLRRLYQPGRRRAILVARQQRGSRIDATEHAPPPRQQNLVPDVAGAWRPPADVT